MLRIICARLALSGKSTIFHFLSLSSFKRFCIFSTFFDNKFVINFCIVKIFILYLAIYFSRSLQSSFFRNARLRMLCCGCLLLYDTKTYYMIMQLLNLNNSFSGFYQGSAVVCQPRLSLKLKNKTFV